MIKIKLPIILGILLIGSVLLGIMVNNTPILTQEVYSHDSVTAPLQPLPPDNENNEDNLEMPNYGVSNDDRKGLERLKAISETEWVEFCETCLIGAIGLFLLLAIILEMIKRGKSK